MTGTPAPRGPRRRSSVRARIAAACAGLFLVAGGALVAATYSLVSHTSSQALQYQGVAGEFSLPKGCPAPAPGATPPPQSPAPPQGHHLSGHCKEPQRVRDFQAGATDQAGSDRRNLLVYSLAGLGVATVLAAGLGWAVSGRVLRPLRAITTAARTASQENLDQRLELAGPADELKELGDTFDGMLARLDAAFASQRRFVASASHELRTPLTEMRTLIDVTLAKPARSAAQLETVLAGVHAAVGRSEELIEALLTLARSDRGLAETEVVDLPTAVEDAIDAAAPAAAARQIQIDTDLAAAQVTGDRVLLERLASNLIDNAVRHNTPGGWVRAATRCETGSALLTITSSGNPIPPDQVNALFEPFHRLSGRAGEPAGTGLGLSIVASVAKAHGGRAEARARPGGGLEVQITLPSTAHGGGRPPILAGPQAAPPAG